MLASRRKHADQQCMADTTPRPECIPGLGPAVGTKRKASAPPSSPHRPYDAFALYEFQARTADGDENMWVHLPEYMGSMVERRKERLYLSGKHDCSLHCDSPSECVRKKYAAMEAERLRLAREGRLAVTSGQREQVPGIKGERKKDWRKEELENVEEGDEEMEEGDKEREELTAGGSSSDGKAENEDIDVEVKLHRQAQLYLSQDASGSNTENEDDTGTKSITNKSPPSPNQLIYELYAGPPEGGDFATTATEPDLGVGIDDYTSNLSSYPELEEVTSMRAEVNEPTNFTNQRRRSLSKIAQLTGQTSFLPCEDVENDTVNPFSGPAAGRDLCYGTSTPGYLEVRGQAVDALDIVKDGWAIGQEPPLQSTLGGIEETGGTTPASEHADTVEERDLIELLMLQNTWMRGEMD